MSHTPDEALEILRTVWDAQGQSAADLDQPGEAKSCKRMADVSFDGLADEGADLRAAWRARLDREGKLNKAPGATVADLVQRSPGSRA